jgi:hypothetical protein
MAIRDWHVGQLAILTIAGAAFEWFAFREIASLQSVSVVYFGFIGADAEMHQKAIEYHNEALAYQWFAYGVVPVAMVVMWWRWFGARQRRA